MLRLGLAVPPGFVVSAAAYAEQAVEWRLAERLSAPLAACDWEAAAGEASELFKKSAMLPRIENAIRAAYRELGAQKVAVRSSATAEDLSDASFAGQQETYLDVAGEEDVLVSIRRCWASLYGPRALHYRHVRGISHLLVQMAVVVQQMVPSEAAGVLFTVDPVDQRSDRMLLSAAPGLGEAVVSGHRRGDTYRLRREPYGGAAGENGDPAEAAARAGQGSIAIADRDLETPGRSALSDAQILELGRLGLRLEAHFGCPQDVEFAAAGGRIFLLQSRPITTLGTAEIEPIAPLGDLDFLQRRSLPVNLDRFPIAPRPLDQWMLTGVFGALAHMIRYIGFDVTEADERAVHQTLWREASLPPKSRPTLRLFGIPLRIKRGLGQDWTAWWNAGPMDRLRRVIQPVDFTALDDTEIVRRVDEMVDVFGSVLGERFEPMLGLMGMMGVGIGVRLAVGTKRAPTVLADLLGGLHTRTSETNRAIFLLAREAIAAGPSVVDTIRSGRIDELHNSGPGQCFLAAFNAFLDEYGHREGVCLYLSTPVWRQDPEPVWSLIRGFMQISELPEDAGAERYRTALEEVESRLRAAPGAAAAFRGLLDRVRAIMVYREDTHFDLTRPLAAMQSAVAEIGRRLHDRGLLPSPAEVFYLTETEVRTWLFGQAPPVEQAHKLLKRRRATYQVVNGRWQKRRFTGGTAGDELRGTGASAGVVRARARIVRGEHQFDRLKPGEILVCSYTNPSWTPLFAYAAGVVTDTGGPSSHAAIVAREYAIPAVMGAAGATERIEDGQEILVDGTEGTVRIMRPAAVAPPLEASPTGLRGGLA
jgi:pyruvate,water dikinase